MKWILSPILLLICITSYAGHLVGVEGHYECLGSNQYKIFVSLFEEPSASTEDLSIILIIYDNDDGSLYDELQVNYTSEQEIATSYENECTGETFEDEMNDFKFEETLTLPNNTNGYKIAYWRCCRPSVVNVVDNSGMAVVLDIPSNADAPCNNSPNFNAEPIKLLCANEPFEVDFSATDPDGDQLVYKLFTPYTSGDYNAQRYAEFVDYQAYFSPPFDEVTYQAGYSGTNPFGNNDINIDANGLLTGSAGTVGDYFVLGIQVEEWRNGKLLGTIIRDLPITVVDCGRLEAVVLDPIIETTGNTANTATTASCSPTVSFENESVNADEAQWDFGVAGTTTDVSSDLNASFTYPGPGVYEVILISSNSSYIGCQDTAITQVTILPSMDVNFDQSAVCNSNKAIFSNASVLNGATGITYSWTFNGNEISTNATDSFDFNSPGTYNVQLLLQNSDGCNDSITLPMTVGGVSTSVSMSADLTDICPGEKITYTASGGSAYEFLVNGISVGTNSTFSSSSLNAGDIITAISGPGSQCTDSTEMTVVPAANPTFSLTADPICVGAPAIITGAGDITSVNWQHTNSTTNQVLNISANNATASTMFYGTGVSARGCSTLDSVLLVVNPLPIISAGENQVICNGGMATLVATSNPQTNVIDWDWDKADNIQNPTVTPSENTQYLLTATDNNNCTDTSSAWVLLDQYKPEIVDDNITICLGDSVFLDVVEGVNFRWVDSTTNQIISTDQSFSFFPTQSGTFIIVSDDQDGACIDGKDTANIIVNIPLTIEIGDSVFVCDDEAFTLLAETTEGVGQWYVMDNQNLQSVAPMNKAQVDRDKMTALDEEIYVWEVIDEQCDQKLKDTLIVTNKSTGIRDATLSYLPTGEVDEYNFKTSIAGEGNPVWLIDGEIVSTEKDFNFYFEETGLHPIELTITNDYGCQEKRYSDVLIERITTLFVPNAFISNSPEIKTFKPVGLFQEIENYTFSVFNRWGENIFTTDDVDTGWDGHIRQSNAQSDQGTYVYKINYNIKGEDEKRTKKGMFLLLN